MTFLGDEGRDVRIVRDLITQGNLVFIGPQTSVGNMYLGPLYYYMMAPALFLSSLNPVGPAIMIAFLSVATILFTWYVARVWFGKQAAIITAMLYTISPVAIIYGRTSSNPNPMPFFALLSIWGIYQVWGNKKYLWLPLIGISTAFALQMHYLAFLLIPTIGLFWFLTFIKIKKEKSLQTSFIKKTIFGILLFLLLMSPLILFDIKHQGMNLSAFSALLSVKSGVFNLGEFFTKPLSIFSFSQSALLSGNEKPALIYSIILCLVSATFMFLRRRQNHIKILSAWILFPILGLSLYSQPIYIHYLGLIYPALFLLSGSIVSNFLKKYSLIKWATIIFLIAIITNALSTSPTLGSPNRQLQRTEQVADLIIKESKEEPFNLGLISKQNYDESYRYFLENKNSALEKDQNKITNQLFVICEDGDTCKPEGHSQYQIAIFGIAKIDNQWEVDNIKIYRLIHPK
ncbi:MAG TPA: glycosyltransferase family 39 protein [Spirochaetia bacterium]|nr:glycosyltransferase family 39 protein [Spirochaetia bacterium]